MIEIENESEPKEIGNPFPGLRPFETDEYELFFGREGQSDALISRLQRAHFLAVVGTSGSGKSSLVRAGLLPALRGGMMAGAGSGWRICIMRPGSDPIGNLALALAEEDVLLEAGAGLPPAEAEAVIEATLRRGALGLVDAVRRARLEPHEKLMVVVDQFEELFRFRAARVASSTGDDASAFVKLLLEAAQQSELPIYVVPTMRSDFLGDCAQFQGLPEAINEGQYLIPRMTRDERRFAITGPIGVTRGKVAEPLVNRLMNDVGDNPDQLPILQHALMRTWDYWSAHRRDGEPIGLEHYEAIGTMSEALSEHADEAFNELPDERSRLIAELLFKALTERGADNREIRRPTSLKDICAIANASPAEVGAVIDVFRGGGRSFLMPSAGTDLKSETVIDISHESLIRNWDRLQAWVKDEADSARIYRRLAGAATDYHQGAGGLLDDVTLQYVIKWQERSKPSWHWGVRYHSEYNTAMGYLEMSSRSRDARIEAEEERDRRELATAHAFADKQARSARRLRWLAAGMALMFLISIGLAAFAIRAKWSAERAKSDAEKATTAAIEASTALQVSTGKLQTKTNELQDSIKELKVAEEGRKQEAMRADDRAEAARKAEEQARIDADNAVKQAKVADAARKLAEANEKESKAAVERGDLMRKGLQALQRKQARDAQRAFGELADMLEPLQRGAADPPVGQRSLTPEQAVAELGWAYSRKGTAGWQAGQLADAEQDFEKALESLYNEKADKKDPVLFETYDGVAHVYHEIASAGVLTNDMGEDRKIDSKQYFKQAEEFYTKALEFHKASFTPNSRMIEPREIAEEYMNLARLYRDMGRIEDAESNYNSAVESKLRLNRSDAAFAVLREQAEFYRTLNRLDKALEVYNRLIQLQEKRYDSLDEGRDLADSYNELGQMQAANGEATNAESAFSMADLIQRTALKLREKERFQQPNPTRWATLIGELVTVLDKLGDAYLRLEKFDAAESAYQKALEERKTDGKEMEKSWTKLARLYLRMKDYAKAEEHNQRLVEFFQNKPRSTEYAGALFRLGALYAEADRNDEAELKYRAALVIFKERKEWSYENLIHSRLSKIFEKQGRLKDREQALNDRVNSLQGYFDKVVIQPRPPNDLVVFVSEYLNAVNALGYFYDKTLNDKIKAAAAYQRAFAASQYITGKIYNDKTLKFYALVLEDYRTLLGKLGNNALATQVGVVAQGLTEKLRQDDERRQQNAVPVQQSSYEATSSAP